MKLAKMYSTHPSGREHIAHVYRKSHKCGLELIEDAERFPSGRTTLGPLLEDSVCPLFEHQSTRIRGAGGEAI